MWGKVFVANRIKNTVVHKAFQAQWVIINKKCNLFYYLGIAITKISKTLIEVHSGGCAIPWISNSNFFITPISTQHHFSIFSAVVMWPNWYNVACWKKRFSGSKDSTTNKSKVNTFSRSGNSSTTFNYLLLLILTYMLVCTSRILNNKEQLGGGTSFLRNINMINML